MESVDNDDAQRGQFSDALYLERAGAVSTGLGSFRFWFATQRWEWSPEVYRMHGYEPGAVTPTTELLLSHKHPDDRAQVAEAITRSLREGEPFSSRHRFLDTAGRVHHVMVVSDRIVDDAARPIGTQGYYIDLGATIASIERQTLDTFMPEIIESRAVIEQAKGVLMYFYRIDAEQAFRVLQWRSQETNIKLRHLAEALVQAVPHIPGLATQAVTAFDHLLLTIHEHIAPENP